MENKRVLKSKRKARIRAKVTGTASRPRLAVFRSNTSLYAQVIDDQKHQTVVSASVKGKTVAMGKTLGAEIAQKAKKKGISTVVFDRGGFLFHGAIKAVADGAKEGGLTI